MNAPGRSSLAFAIALALVVKILLLYTLWYLFFSHPQTNKMRLPTAQVERHLLATSAPANPTAKVNNGTRR